MSRPRIGITTYAQNKDGHFTLPRQYIDSIRRAGGIPLLLAPGEAEVEATLALFDGLLLAGGGDMHPDTYSGKQHHTVYDTDDERDTSELQFATAALQRQIPILAICRGLQVINVALGGTLIEHLPDEVGDEVSHRAPPRDPIAHRIHVAPDTRLAGLLGATEFEAKSWHHQAIRDVACDLAIVATAPDGTIEAVEMDDSRHPWMFAVQWHPELTAKTSPVQQRLFDAFIQAARQSRSQACD